MSAHIVFRPSRGNSEEGYLSLRLYYQKQVRQVATGLRLKTSEWDDKNSQVILTDFSSERRSYLQRLNSELQNKLFHLKRLLAECQEKEDSDIDSLVCDFKQSLSPNSFSSYVTLLVDKLNSQKRFRTAEAYLTLKRKIIGFNKNRDFSLDKITSDYVEDFE